MKFTHNALTSITVDKVENIVTSMTRAGSGDDTFRKQREKEKYLNYKKEQETKEERRREEFFKEREEKLAQAQKLTEKRHLKRNKKKDRQKQQQKKNQMLKKFGIEPDEEPHKLPTLPSAAAAADFLGPQLPTPREG